MTSAISTQTNGRCASGDGVIQERLFFEFKRTSSEGAVETGPKSGLPRWELNFSQAFFFLTWPGVDGVANSLKRAHNRSNNPFAVRECNALFTVMCNPLFRTRAYPKNKVRQCWGQKARNKENSSVPTLSRLRLHQAKFDFFSKGQRVLDGRGA